MLKIIRIPVLVVILFFIYMTTLHAGWLPWSDDTLVSIDDHAYSTDDFRNWWENWREKDMIFPATAGPYIDWVLLYRQAENMQLYDDPGYQRKVMIFLKVRSLMMLKYEEVDSKINISEEDLWQRYKKSYVPLWQVNIISFHNQQEADAAYEKLIAGTITVQQLHDLKSPEGGAFTVSSKWQRPHNTHRGWQEILDDLKKGGFSKPVPYRNGVIILQMLSVNGAEKQDFEKLRKGIRQKLRKEKKGLYTNELLEKLLKKYHVQINKERLKDLDINAPDAALTDEKLITWDRGSISEKEFVHQVRSQRQYRRKNKFNDDNFQYKEQVLGGILSQTLTTLDGLERHYEKKAPFDKVYQFYTRNRLIKSLEQEVFQPQVKVSDEEIKTFYDKNIKEFTRPGWYRIAVVEGSEDDMKKLWTEVLTGSDFISLAQERDPHNSPVHSFMEDQIDPVLKKALVGLGPDEVSRVAAFNGHYGLVQLIEYKPGHILPLDRSKNDIVRQLESNKIMAIRNAYLDKLRAAATIKVNDKVWQKIRKNMVQADEEKQN